MLHCFAVVAKKERKLSKNKAFKESFISIKFQHPMVFLNISDISKSINLRNTNHHLLQIFYILIRVKKFEGAKGQKILWVPFKFFLFFFLCVEGPWPTSATPSSVLAYFHNYNNYHLFLIYFSYKISAN